jgi:hypothetical protein
MAEAYAGQLSKDETTFLFTKTAKSEDEHQ